MAPKKQPPPPSATKERSSSSSSGGETEDGKPLKEHNPNKGKTVAPADDEEGEAELSDSGFESNEEQILKAKTDDKFEDQSGCGDGSDSDTEDDEHQFIAAQRPPRVPDTSIKQLNSCRMDDCTLSGLKSTMVAIPGKSILQSSSKKEEIGSGKKRKLFERFWNEDAGKEILRGIIDFHSSHGKKLPSSKTKIDGLFEFLKSKSSFDGADFTKPQLVNKVRRIREKFKGVSTKRKGRSPSSPKPMDKAVYKLAEKIWGPRENGNAADVGGDVSASDEEINEHEVSPKPPKRSNIKTNDSLVDIADAYPNLFEAFTTGGTLKLSARFARTILERVDTAKLEEVEGKLKKHILVANQNRLHWLDLMKGAMQLLIDYGDTSN